jgi:cytidine deaminase
MEQQQYNFQFEVYSRIDELTSEDAQLLIKAREATNLAYAPYSNFKVGAAAKLSNGQIVTGSNQENASFPVGMCAERVLLASVSGLYPQIPVHTIAVSYHNINGNSNHPISPCGICRQTLLEYESRDKNQIRLILGGLQGKIYVIPSVSVLLPLSFTSKDFE